MSTYSASIIKSGTTLDLNQLITELTSEIPAGWQEATTSSVNSNATTSASTHFSITRTVDVDEVILFISTVQYSCSTASTTVLFNHRNGATTKTPDVIGQDTITGTGGSQGTVTMISVWSDLSGSQTFDVRFARYAGAGTAYAGLARAHLVCLKRRS